jgi:hypothetical protein
MILWKGHPRFRTYNLEKLVKYRVCMCVIFETATAHICTMETSLLKTRSLKRTIFSALEVNLDLWHHIYVNYYNSATILESSLSRNIMVCGTISFNRGISVNWLGHGRS